MTRETKLGVGELASIVSRTTFPAIVAARFALIVAGVALLFSAGALAVALHR